MIGYMDYGWPMTWFKNESWCVLTYAFWIKMIYGHSLKMDKNMNYGWKWNKVWNGLKCKHEQDLKMRMD